MGIATINGCEWTTADIHRILQNEKYAGNMLLQKRFRENHLTKRMIRNDGQLPKYFVEESHPAIIEKVFLMLFKRNWKNSISDFPLQNLLSHIRLQEKYNAPVVEKTIGIK